MTTRWIANVALTVSVLLPAGLTGQEPESPEEVVATALARALDAGIPVELLQSKIDEGKAKGVSMDRIAAAVEARLRGLTRAQGALDRQNRTDVTPDELQATADALDAGVSEDILAHIQASTPRDRRMVATVALTSLVEAGHAPEHALARVQSALEQGPEALSRLRSETAREMRGRGRRPNG